ncbi:uncharacterized protein LOC106660018 [Trichogramma pretiosum]|uniref:uncharacterized protein LOC106660018 n=1 Tax=Trichogramma pretiosum TaxID=7493 RepID=UPI0006C94508|nr:uncharacterized protein LOC106660018 [Trichogramma pretiosum]
MYMNTTMVKLIIWACIVVIHWFPTRTNAHGRLMDPVNRGSAWRKRFPVPANYDDMGNNCGGFGKQYGYNRGQCGVCGDDFSLPRPRPNENGGKYGRGVIVRRYQAGGPIQLQVEITANHKGYFEFSLCPLNSPQDLETEECFNAHPIYLKNGKRQFPVSENLYGIVNISGFLPPNVRCKRCVLRWHYHCGNNIPLTGNQETFRTCSDITIE